MFTYSSSQIAATAQSFKRDENGAIAIIFSLCAMVLFMVTGLAIDMARLMHAQTSMSSAADAASLAAAKGLKIAGLNDAEVLAVAQKYFDINMQNHGGDYAVVQSFNVDVNRGNNSVAVNVNAEVPTIFAKLAGFDKFTVPKSSVAIYDSKDIEVGIQLDLTGSMCMPCSKITALKDAVAGTNGLLDILLPDGGTSNSVRIGLAPFAAGVNAGRYAAAVSNNRAGANGCVYERTNAALQATEAAPIGASSFKVSSDLARGAGSCRSGAEVVALSDDKAMLRSEINGWSTGGSTAGHLGASWAWGLISPEWASIWGGTAPAPYNDGRTQKFVILMTDGIYNTVGGVSNGDTGSTAAQSNNFARATCTAMKDKGVTVYTIGFQAPASAQAQLKACASGNSKFFDAQDADTLRAAFRAIAEEINSLRLSS